jgi:hypothetical protein
VLLDAFSSLKCTTKYSKLNRQFPYSCPNTHLYLTHLLNTSALLVSILLHGHRG